MPRALVTLALLLAADVPDALPDGGRHGYASAYAPGVMEGVVRWRLDTGTWRTPPPLDWYTAAGYVATNDCNDGGRMMTLIAPDGRAYRVLAADCGGRGEGQGADRMTTNRIVAELDARLWAQLTERHGRPLEVTLR